MEKYPKIKSKIKMSDAGNPKMDSNTLEYLIKKFDIEECKAIMKYLDNLKLWTGAGLEREGRGVPRRTHPR